MNKKVRSKIGLWSGASPSSKVDFKSGSKKLNDLGFDTVSHLENIKQATKPESSKRKFLAGSDRIKVDALIKLLKDPSIHDILCVRGGYGTLRLIELLEAQEIPKSKKRIWGFSDQTTLQNYLYLRSGLAWVHSPMLSSNAFISGDRREIAPWIQDSEGLELTCTLKLMKGSFTPKSLVARAPLLGGNLTCLASLLTFQPLRTPKKDFYLFLEDISEKAYRLDRVLTMLRYSGFLKHCRGIFLGYFTDCPNWSGVLSQFSQDCAIPIYTELPAGHDRPNVPLAMGVDLEVSSSSKNFGALKVRFPKLKIQG